MSGGRTQACTEGYHRGASFGRQTDTIASLLGGITGALYGASALRDEWIERCEAANADLLSDIEGSDTTFEDTARRLLDALEQEHETVTERKRFLEKLLARSLVQYLRALARTAMAHVSR